jgi:flagellar basal body rod protein FlgG
MRNKTNMTTHATGTFEVKMTPQTSDDKDAGAAVGRYSLDKQFSGGLEATSKGEMLAIASAVQGSAGYVAMEQVTGTLSGRKGAFALQHSGTMTRGEGQLTVTVIPDSGTDQLVGLSGRMDIQITDGKHYYDFEYAFAEAS